MNAALPVGWRSRTAAGNEIQQLSVLEESSRWATIDNRQHRVDARTGPVERRDVAETNVRHDGMAGSGMLSAFASTGE